MKHAFEGADFGHDGKRALNQHPLRPRFMPTRLEIQEGFAAFAKMLVAEGNGLGIKLMRQRTKILIVGIGSRPIPAHDLSLLVE